MFLALLLEPNTPDPAAAHYSFLIKNAPIRLEPSSKLLLSDANAVREVLPPLQNLAGGFRLILLRQRSKVVENVQVFSTERSVETVAI